MYANILCVLSPVCMHAVMMCWEKWVLCFLNAGPLASHFLRIFGMPMVCSI